MSGKEQIVYDLSNGRKRWFVSAKEAAEVFGVSDRTVRRWCAAAGIVKKTPGKQGKYSVRDLVDYIHKETMQ